MANLNVNTSNDADIRAYARELGINNWHNMRMDNLRAKIEEAEATAKEIAVSEIVQEPELTPPPELMQPVLSEPVLTQPPAAAPLKSIDDMSDEEAIRAAEAERARQFLRESKAKTQQREAGLSKDKVNMTEIMAKAEKVKISVPFQEGKPLERSVKVNGIKWVIPVETDMWVPKPIAEALNDAMKAEFQNYKNFRRGMQRFLTKENVIYK